MCAFPQGIGLFPKEMAFWGRCCKENRLFGQYLLIFAHFWPIFTFLVHFDLALWERFWPFFRYFWDSSGLSGGPPRFISPILGQFWPFFTTFGPFSDYFWAENFFGFFCRKMAFWHRYKGSSTVAQ